MPGLVLTCGYIALFLFLIGRLRFFSAPGLRRRTIGWLFLLKVAAGTAMWWTYTYHYPDRSTADIFKFFDDGNVLFGALPHHPGDYLRMLFGIGNDTPYFDGHYYSVMNHWYRRYDTGYYNDAHTMVRFNALVRFFSFGVYHVHTVFASFLSLIGLVALYKAFTSHVPGLGRAWAAGLFLWPSTLFWGSAPLKEALLFFGLGLFLLPVFRRMGGKLPWTGWAAMLAGLLVQLSLKSYVLACMLPGLAALWWCRRTGGRLAVPKFITAYGLALLVAVVASRLSPALDVAALIRQKQHDMLGVVAAMKPGSYIPTGLMQPGWGGLLNGVPHALYLAFVAPLATWNIGVFGLLGALENLALLALVPLAAWWAKPWQEVDRPLFLYCLGFCLALGLLIGWTTPVVGALVRYRVPLLPFYSLAFLLVIRPQRMPGLLHPPLT